MGAAEAGLYLRDLLATYPAYRRQWEQHAVRVRVGRVTGSAVCLALARPGEPADALRYRVRRALAGTVLTPATLRRFIAGFGIEEQHAWRLWSLLDVGNRPVAPDRSDGGAYHTVALHEHHYLGADGLPLRHRTVQVIAAVDGTIDHYPYFFDTRMVDIEVLRGGCRADTVQTRGDGLFTSAIRLDRPIEPGETATIEYVMRFAYDLPPPTEFRRAAARPIDNVDIRVEFHPRKRPARVWWTVWDGPDHGVIGEIVEREPVVPDGLAVQRFLTGVQGTVGFTWEW